MVAQKLNKDRGDRGLVMLLFLPVILAVVGSAWVNLQLFQDGAFYLYQVVQTQAVAIMHERFSAILVQAPIVLLLHLLPWDQVEDTAALMRFVFCLGYGLIPLLCLFLSWQAVQGSTKRLLLWPWLIILFVNVVNFSWVSEILMALQLACPLLLGVIAAPMGQANSNRQGRWVWPLTMGLSAVIFGLHPLTVLIFGAATVGLVTLSLLRKTKSEPKAVNRGLSQTNHRRFYWRMALFFGSVTIAKGMWAIASLNAYEKRFLEAYQRNQYLFGASPEDRLFLLIGIVIGGLCLFAQLVHHRPKALSRLYGACMGLAIAAACILIAQYSQNPFFQLKTGLSIGAILLLFLMMFIDAALLHSRGPQHRQRQILDTRFRQRLMITLSCIFLVIILAKSLMWHTAVTQLRTVMIASPTDCIERYSDEFDWLYRSPHQMLNHWSLPILALLQGDRATPTVIIAESCQGYETQTIIDLYPWGKISKDNIRPPLFRLQQ